MAQVTIGDQVTVLKDGKTVRGKVTKNAAGVVSVALDDGTTIDNVQHVSGAGKGANGWYSRNDREKLGTPGDDPNVINLA